MSMQKQITVNVRTNEKLWPYQVVDVLQAVMEKRQKTHPDGEWKKMSSDEHITHAIQHLFANAQDVPDTEDHLAQAFTRLMMAVAVERGLADA